jgi:hypothetical protein
MTELDISKIEDFDLLQKSKATGTFLVGSLNTAWLYNITFCLTTHLIEKEFSDKTLFN